MTMTKAEQETYKNMKSIGYWSVFGIVEVKQIEHGIEDYMIVVAGTTLSSSVQKVHRLRIKTTKAGRDYVKLYDTNLYLDDCLRV